MKPLIQLRKATEVFVVALGLTYFGLSPVVHAVNPPPDGGYPGGNTAEGQNALLNLGSGTYNTAVGYFSLASIIEGNFCTGVGVGALLVNAADYNTATGAGALLSNTTGNANMANGTFALMSNTTGESNTAVGTEALKANTIGNANTATGDAALFSNITGGDNTAVGTAALFFNTGSRNTAIGRAALFSNTFGANNTATGYAALQNNTSGPNNTATGHGALESNTTGSSNTAVGFLALLHNTTGVNNTAGGFGSLINNISGDANTALGWNAGVDVTGSGNVCIGQGVSGEADVNSTTWIRNVNTLTQNFSAGVNDYVTVRLSDGRLGHTAVVSSQRYKQDIKPLAAASEALYALNPVSFRFKKEYDEAQALGFGLIAEEVEKVEPALVYRNQKGQAESVRYEMVNAMLLNEFLKEHRKNEEQGATIARQQEEIRALRAELRVQASQIQKVSAQLGAASPSLADLN